MDNRRKFLIIGANGLIGETISKEIGSPDDWAGTFFSRPREHCLSCDIADKEDVKKIFDLVRPAYVMHAAGLGGGVNYCEKNPAQAKKIHLDGTLNVGRLCQKYNAKFVFISSECVFDGKKESYNENDGLNPPNMYGKYKAESEIWIKENLNDYIIVRSMSVFGWQPQTLTPNAVMSLYFALSKGEKISIPSFRFGTPTYVKDLAKAILELCVANEKGIFHIVGNSYLSRYEWLKKVSEKLEWNSSLISEQKKMATNTVTYPLRIKLNTRKFCSTYKTKLHTLEEALALLQDDIFSYPNTFT